MIGHIEVIIFMMFFQQPLSDRMSKPSVLEEAPTLIISDSLDLSIAQCSAEVRVNKIWDRQGVLIPFCNVW